MSTPYETKKLDIPEHLEIYQESDPYLKWQETEGVKVIVDYKFEDLNAVELGPWERKGGQGAVIVIPSAVLENDLHLVSIDPGNKSAPERHMYEEIVYVLSGQGITDVWLDDGHKSTVEWRAGSLFTIPLNCWYQHFNASGFEPARYVAMTNAPPVMRMWRNSDFIFNNPFQFRDRYQPENTKFFSGDGELMRDTGKVFRTLWKTNFVPDVDTMGLWEYSARGAGGLNTHFALDGNVNQAHVSEFPSGTYKKGHCHGPGAHLVILGGVGFSLLWWENSEKKIRIDWKRGGLVIIPAEDTFHQHFNTGPMPARYLALRAADGSPRVGAPNESFKEGGRQIEYVDEDPEIHRLFETDLTQHGAECEMRAFVPWCTGRE